MVLTEFLAKDWGFLAGLTTAYNFIFTQTQVLGSSLSYASKFLVAFFNSKTEFIKTHLKQTRSGLKSYYSLNFLLVVTAAFFYQTRTFVHQTLTISELESGLTMDWGKLQCHNFACLWLKFLERMIEYIRWLWSGCACLR